MNQLDGEWRERTQIIKLDGTAKDDHKYNN